eukprot:14475-Heterococcus_DN1.PRE.1
MLVWCLASLCTIAQVYSTKHCDQKLFVARQQQQATQRRTRSHVYAQSHYLMKIARVVIMQVSMQVPPTHCAPLPLQNVYAVSMYTMREPTARVGTDSH